MSDRKPAWWPMSAPALPRDELDLDEGDLTPDPAPFRSDPWESDRGARFELGE